jgi:hypothetical protein
MKNDMELWACYINSSSAIWIVYDNHLHEYKAMVVEAQRWAQAHPYLNSRHQNLWHAQWSFNVSFVNWKKAVAHQIFSNKAHKVMNWKTLMLCCYFNLEAKGNVYKWEQRGLGTCTRLTLISSQMMLWFHPHPIWYCKIILNPTKTLEWVLDGFSFDFWLNN